MNLPEEEPQLIHPAAGQEDGNPRIIQNAGAGVAELADAVALGATGRKSLEVQILSPAPHLDVTWRSIFA
jgi:hypothetical protein